MDKKLTVLASKESESKSAFTRRGFTFDMDTRKSKVETQMVWSESHAALFVGGYKTLRMVFFLIGPICVCSSKIIGTGLAFVFLCVWGFALLGVASIHGLRWSAPDVLTSDKIFDLYSKVSVCPYQRQIIQDAVKNKLVLRQRDLDFAQRIFDKHLAYLSQKEEDEKMHRVLYDIRHDS